MKKFISVLLMILIFAFTLTGCASKSEAQAASSTSDSFTLIMQIDNPIMTVNGAQKEIDEGRGTVPVIVNSRTLVPIRAVIETMGGKVLWDQDTQKIIIELLDKNINLAIGSNTAYVNNEQKELTTSPEVINGRTMLPIRFISENLGYKVDWEADEQIITISMNKNKLIPISKSDNIITGNSKILIAYFSRIGNTEISADVDAISSASINSANGKYIGNTGLLANWIQEETNGDLFLIETAEKYPLDYDKTVEIGEGQNQKDIHPQLASHIANIDNYDIIFLGYPIWNYDIPVAIDSFLEEYNLSDKMIIPFCTSGASDISVSTDTIKKYQPNAKILDGFTAHHKDIFNYEKQVKDWVKNLNIKNISTSVSNKDMPNIQQEETVKNLVVYFSNTGTTKKAANYISNELNADIFEIKAAKPYTSEDLNYSNSSSRATVEQNDAKTRPEIENKLENIEQYDIIYLGYPIWCGQAPRIINTFLESYDFSGKIIIPFCTSHSSGIGSSDTNLHSLANNAKWISGKRFGSEMTENDITEWLKNIKEDIN